MTNQQGVEILSMCTQFFAESLAFNTTLYAIAKWAFLLAIGLIVANALLAFWKALRTPPPSDGGIVLANVSGQPSLGDLLKAFPALIDSLAKAPAAIVLIVLGLLLVWVPTVDAPAICEAPLAKTIGVDAPAGQAGNSEDAPAQPGG